MNKLLLVLCLLASPGFAQKSRLDSLKKVLTRLATRSADHVTDTLRCRTTKALVRAYLNLNVDSSAHYNEQLIGLCLRANMPKELIHAYQYAGYLYQIKGDYYQSIRFHYKALPLTEKQKEYTLMAASYGWLAHAYFSLKDYKRAYAFCQQGIDTLQHHPAAYDVYVHATILNTLGATYREQGKLTQALKTNQDLYTMAKKAGVSTQWYEVQGLNAIGQLYNELGDTTNAWLHYRQALPLSRALGSVDLECSLLLNMGQLCLKQKNWQQALIYANMARAKAVRTKNSSNVAEADETLYKTYRQTGETAKALQAYERFVLLKDSLQKEKNEHRIETLQAEYDNVQKTSTLQQQQVEMLSQRVNNQQLTQTRNGLFATVAIILVVAGLLLWNNRRLQAKNREIDLQRGLLETARADLANSNKNLEHRVAERTAELLSANQSLLQKNAEIKQALFKGQTIERKRVALELHDNLSSLLSAVNMSIQSLNPHNLSEPEQSLYRSVKQLIQNAYAEVRNISHNILPAELDRDGLAPTLTTFLDQLNHSLAIRFSLVLTGLSARLPVEIEFNVYSIVLELVNNAIKHANATAVRVELTRTDEGIAIAVSDDGVGMGQQTGKRGVGLQNIQARLDSLGGTFSVLQPHEPGTRIRIHIPVDIVDA
ncbi:ATP-binding protein [Fibrella aquatilis]|uniref:Tetratricopeptide repeat protein n=1 Tax=Fibrella aquatilis TaxID=2817059 RepID=A0A939JXA1_9BACT|nr:sensor histidine kinase [Fibrella aquatilis]MBO0930819.1 tetratricopeptide repeat protein [Fibrella aquatilis]